MATRKPTVTVEETRADASLSEPLDTPQPTPVEVLRAEAEAHAAWLTSVRERAYTFASDHGICGSGRNSFLRGAGIPFDEQAHSGTSRRQPAITVDPFGGLDPSWLTVEGINALIEKQRADYSAKRALIARGILRAEMNSYATTEATDAALAELGLTRPLATVTASVSLRDVSVTGLPEDVTQEVIAESFAKVIEYALAYAGGNFNGDVKVTPPTVRTSRGYGTMFDNDRWEY